MSAPEVQPRWAAFMAIGAGARQPAGPCRNAEFICWIARQWQAWKSEVRHVGGGLSRADHAAFDAWLSARVAESRAIAP